MSISKQEAIIRVPAPKFETATFTIVGNAPLVINRFSQKAMEQMKAKQAMGSQAKKEKGPREAKDFDAAYEAAKHVSREGWLGLPAAAIRSAMISACRTVNFKMTLAKLSVFVEADGFDVVDGVPLIRITKGTPRRVDHAVRNESGVADIRPRPMWEAWEADVRVRWDSEQFSADDVVNLLMRVGAQVGICEGRPDSKNSAGMGWGTFYIKEG